MQSRTIRRFLLLPLVAAGISLGGGACPPDGDKNGDSIDAIQLNVVKLTTSATTESGPKVGDGIIAFDALNSSVLAWLRVGETAADVKEVPAPPQMTHDTKQFACQGKKIVVRDRNSGAIYVYDTELDSVTDIPLSSVNVFGETHAGDGNYVASINATVTTQDGPHQLIKVTDISDINNYVTTPFDDPTDTPNAISVDAATGLIAVRGGNTFYIYDIGAPGAAIHLWTLSALQGGVGSTSDIKIRGDYIAFFDDNNNFSLLNIQTGTRTQPARNPGRANLGLDIENNIFGFFVTQTEDDGDSIALVNRALSGIATAPDDLIDPAGVFINGTDGADGRVGFGSTISISPNGSYVFVAGAPPVDVDARERLYLSIDGANFQPIEDAGDPTGFLSAAGVSASNNVVAFLIPSDINTPGGSVSVGYAELPPP